uniref:Uncharacterized protein n=1 Tax=Anguilla anguilla TaxID=7936 RepID=A0A0E9XCE1_ANGAN
MAGSLAVEQQQCRGVLVRHLLEDVVCVLQLFSPNSKVDPGSRQLRQCGIFILLLHLLQFLPCQINSVKLQQHLYGHCHALQTFSLVQGPQSCIRIPLVEVNGGGHEQEGGVGYINALRHLFVKISHYSIPFAFIGKVLGKHFDGLKLCRGAGLDIIQHHTVLPLGNVCSVQKHVSFSHFIWA